MVSGVHRISKPHRAIGRGALPLVCLGLALGSTSCVPAGYEAGFSPSLAAPTIIPEAAAATLQGPQARALNAALPIAATVNPAAASYPFEARTPLDRLRSLDCLAQAIYYEAASESEDGQRAVAQVVLNRVRHPAWPDSVCGVVYQGPMRPGGGCQFTFTCDGSLLRRPAGIAWTRARRLAAEALAGQIFAPVGLSTHYHTHAVFPSWAPRLTKTMVIGAHNFYRLPGPGGEASAFTAAYAGSEPLPRPTMIMARRAVMPIDVAGLLAPPRTPAEVRASVAPPSDIPQDPRWTATNLPESTVRDEYRRSGQWREDAPAAITGR